MCIVIDTSTLARVFDPGNKEHKEFAPVRAWIFSRQGFAIYGGTKYKKEIKEKYLKFFVGLRDAGMAIPINDRLVDAAEMIVKKKTAKTDCDDQHIVALLGVSFCPLFCSTDKRAFPHLRNRELFPQGMPRVKFYTRANNKRLLRRSIPSAIRNSEACCAMS